MYSPKLVMCCYQSFGCFWTSCVLVYAILLQAVDVSEIAQTCMFAVRRWSAVWYVLFPFHTWPIYPTSANKGSREQNLLQNHSAQIYCTWKYPLHILVTCHALLCMSIAFSGEIFLQMSSSHHDKDSIFPATKLVTGYKISFLDAKLNISQLC